MPGPVHLAVNGTLMRGLELNQNMLDAGAAFVREDRTDTHYRLWSVDDVHPAMIRTREERGSVTLEIWEVPAASVAQILMNEPAGLSVGKIVLADGSTVLGVLGEPWLVEDKTEITAFGGWREYAGSLASRRGG
ncbi:glutamyl-tRNA amidotransferase [Roseibium sp. RKSG952]|uniref:allophanate hydrolase-related protein n=1 Tax=Roseibium sp. RKSG952 TaxID=2529384 RepID=UPI0012BC6FE7|nr:glutamyl-tRNA amidotransferase [Roseibium sp. RKSG952]MTH97275.1 glutamyl-tRNA amidotransferase [Roseibium sp. RKSG952]